MAISKIEEIIEDFRQGKMVILMDDEDRENEGDILMAASMVRPEDINFMAKYGRGLICLTLSKARCKQLNLPLMVDKNEAQFSTNFTVSIEAAEGVTTGISAADRARTVQAAVAPDAKPSDVVQPGHIFPLMAQDGGVLTRNGHTEAGCDLARLAGLEPAAVIVEILNEDGKVMKEFHYTEKKHIVSEKTSETMRILLESVVSEGSGKNAYVEGYRIGGKTATSQTLPRSANKYISSFVGFAPADDPEILGMCVIYDPQGIYYGGTIAAPVIRDIFDNILPYMGIERGPVSETKEEE